MKEKGDVHHQAPNVDIQNILIYGDIIPSHLATSETKF